MRNERRNARLYVIKYSTLSGFYLKVRIDLYLSNRKVKIGVCYSGISARFLLFTGKQSVNFNGTLLTRISGQLQMGA